MKKSNILIIGLLAFIVFTGLGSNLLLKKEFDKIDRSNAFSNYKTTILQPARFVRIEGVPVGLTRIQRDSSWKLLTRATEKSLTWRTKGDTLVLTYADHRDVNTAQLALMYQEKPLTYIMLPALAGVKVVNVPVDIAGVSGEGLRVSQRGGKTRLTELKIDNLTIDLGDSGTMEIGKGNKIDHAGVVVEKSGAFTAENVFHDFNISVDSSARVSLPGAVLKKLLRP